MSEAGSKLLAAAPIHEGDAVYIIGGDVQEAIRRAVELAVKEEREACARLARESEQRYQKHLQEYPDDIWGRGGRIASQDLASQIEARGWRLE